MLVEAAAGFVTVVVALKVICALVFICCAAVWLFQKTFGRSRPANAAEPMPLTPERADAGKGVSINKLAVAAK